MNLDNLSLLRAVFESTADGLLIVGNDGKVIHFNTQFHKLWRIPPAILETKDDEKLLGFILSQLSDPDKFISKVMELYKDLEAISNDTIAFLDGRFFERFSRPLKVDDVTVGRVWSFRDVSEHKKSQELFAAITDLSPDIISIIDEEGKLIFNSSASERIHGYEKDELLGKDTFHLIHEDDRQLVAETLADLLKKPSSIASVQYRYLNKNGTYSWMEATASNQIHNALIRGVVTISRQIEKRKQLEQDLSQALRQRDEFISMASHELKTPITSMKLQLQMLQRSKKTLKSSSTAPARSEDIDGLVEQVHSVQRLIDDLLSVSRISTGKLSLEFEKEDLSLLIRSTINRFQELFKEAKCTIELNIQNDVFVYCDKTRITQVLFNLMSNAAKYAPGTLVKIDFIESGDHCEFRIKDHGMGIPKEKFNTIFGLFERGSSANYVTGLGIGLYISRSIVEGHNGTIQVESRPGEGTTFIICLPLVQKNNPSPE